MSKAVLDQQRPQTRLSQVLQDLQANAGEAPIHQELDPGACQESASMEEGWDRIIDGKLIEWGRDPSQLDDEGTITPSKQTIQFAIAIAGLLRSGTPAPTRVVPDAHGGIVFEVHQPNLLETLRLSSDIGMEYCVFENGRLVWRQKFPSLIVS